MPSGNELQNLPSLKSSLESGLWTDHRADDEDHDGAAGAVVDGRNCCGRPGMAWSMMATMKG
jgi:hypothetical protein